MITSSDLWAGELYGSLSTLREIVYIFPMHRLPMPWKRSLNSLRSLVSLLSSILSSICSSVHNLTSSLMSPRSLHKAKYINVLARPLYFRVSTTWNCTLTCLSLYPTSTVAVPTNGIKNPPHAETEASAGSSFKLGMALIGKMLSYDPESITAKIFMLFTVICLDNWSRSTASRTPSHVNKSNWSLLAGNCTLLMPVLVLQQALKCRPILKQLAHFLSLAGHYM